MAVNSTNFKGNEQAQSQSITGALRDSFVNIGATVAIGGGAGAAAGKAASLLPFKPDSTALNFQYEDMFERAISNEDTPDYLKKASGKLQDIIKNSKQTVTDFENASVLKSNTDSLLETVKVAADDTIADTNIQDCVKKIIKDSGAEPQEGVMSKSAITEALEKIQAELNEKLKIGKKSYDEAKSGFISEIQQNTANKEAQEIAKKGAKHLRSRTLIGAGIAIGISLALVLNLLKTYGVIGRKNVNLAQNTQNGGAKSNRAKH
ncbi:MAG: hypothetical protein LUE64_01830 [Candidatus Gastranaerophilales bacterium]|nr:hypothetical protein [Candidatus Gastranaerophilales bacterium]